MTWVFGGTTWAGHAVVASDIQVSWVDDEGIVRYRDCLQKTYLIDRGLMGGFAGSVTLGFRQLRSLSKSLRAGTLPDNCNWRIEWLARQWSPHAKILFDEATDEERAGGCQLLLAGVEPTAPDRSLFGHRARIAVLRGPSFEPEYAAGYREYLHIGSGACVKEHMKSLAYYFGDESFSNLGLNPNHGALALATVIGGSIARKLLRNPVPGISKHFHMHVVGPEESFSFPNNTKRLTESGYDDLIEMPPVAQSLSELESLLQDGGRSSDGSHMKRLDAFKCGLTVHPAACPHI